MEATFQIGYKGVVKLFQQSGQFKSLQAHEVCENDEFDYGYGLDDFLTHKPKLVDRGQSYAYYAVAQFKEGGHAFVVLPKAGYTCDTTTVDLVITAWQGSAAWDLTRDVCETLLAGNPVSGWTGVTNGVPLFNQRVGANSQYAGTTSGITNWSSSWRMAR